MAQQEVPGSRLVALAVVFEGGMAVVALVIGWWLGRSPWVGVALTRAAWPEQAQAMLVGVVATLPLLAGLLLIDRYPVGPLRGLKTFVDRHLVPLFRGLRLWHLAAIAVAAGCGEELLFRGLLQQALVEQLGLWIGVTLAAVAFGVCHWVTRTYAVLAGLIGLYLGFLLVATGNLLAPMIAHALYDFVALVYLVKEETPVATAADEAGPENGGPVGEPSEGDERGI